MIPFPRFTFRISVPFPFDAFLGVPALPDFFKAAFGDIFDKSLTAPPRLDRHLFVDFLNSPGKPVYVRHHFEPGKQKYRSDLIPQVLFPEEGYKQPTRPPFPPARTPSPSSYRLQGRDVVLSFREDLLDEASDHSSTRRPKRAPPPISVILVVLRDLEEGSLAS